MEIDESWRKRWGVYKITNTINGKIYIGSSGNPGIYKRLNDHRRDLRKGIHTNRHLQSAWNKYGEKSFTASVEEFIDDPKMKVDRYLRDRETYYIRKYKCYKEDFGYNIIPGGVGTLGLECSEEKRKKISESNKGKPAWNKGQKLSEKEKENLKMKKSEELGKKIDVYDGCGHFIETLNSVREVYRKYGIARNTISSQCKGKRGSKDYILRYHGHPLNEFGKVMKFVVKDINTNEIVFESNSGTKAISFMENVERTTFGKKVIKIYIRNPEKEFNYKNKYLISFENAPDISNNISGSRQLDIEGTNFSANGET